MNVQRLSAAAKSWPSPPARAACAVDPIVLQIVEGTLNSIEAEIEYAIERTARSPMIREAHDYRVGLFDRYCRKLTGRSYSAMPNAVVRDFPPETMRPGDVFLMNDTYLTEGSIGHLPDLCSTVPVFHNGEVVAYIQAFGHHDDIAGHHLCRGDLLVQPIAHHLRPQRRQLPQCCQRPLRPELVGKPEQCRHQHRDPDRGGVQPLAQAQGDRRPGGDPPPGRRGLRGGRLRRRRHPGDTRRAG